IEEGIDERLHLSLNELIPDSRREECPRDQAQPDVATIFLQKIQLLLYLGSQPLDAAQFRHEIPVVGTDPRDVATIEEEREDVPSTIVNLQCARLRGNLKELKEVDDSELVQSPS